METKKYYVRNIQAKVENIRETVNDILDYFDKVYGQLNETTHFELKVVINELLINAIKHGSKENEDKYVKVAAVLKNNEYAQLVIEDEGDGYDTTNAGQYPTDSAEPESIEELSENGRGIFIVRNLCDNITVNQKGNKVIVNKKLIHM